MCSTIRIVVRISLLKNWLFLDVTENAIVRTVLTNRLVVLPGNAELGHSSVKTATAPHHQPSVTALTIVETVLMKNNATCHVPNSNSNVDQMVAAFWIAGNVMAIQIAKMAQMKTRVFAINENVTLRLNLHARTADASRNCGFVTSIMTVETILTSLPTCADRRTVPLAGNVVQEETTTDVFPNGSSVTAKTTAATNPMNSPKTVPNATPKPTSSVKTTAASPTNGSATFRTTVATILTKATNFAKAATANAPNPNLSAATASVSLHVGDATTRMTAETIPTKLAARNSSARTAPSNVLLATALLPTSGVMAIGIVGICPMRKIVRRGILEDDTVQNHASSATIICVSVKQICVMEQTIVGMVPMRHQRFVPTLTAIR